MPNAHTRKQKVLLHTECLQGSGEVTLALDMAEALIAQGAEVTLVSGSTLRHITDFAKQGRGQVVRLPTLSFQVQEGEYYIAPNPPTYPKTPAIQLYAPEGGYAEAAEPLMQQRSKILKGLLERGGYDRVMTVSGWPFWLGEGLLDKELNALVDVTREQNVPFVTLCREITHADSPAMAGAEAGIVQLFQRNPHLHWLVMGDSTLIPLAASLTIAPDAELNNANRQTGRLPAEQVQHMGYPFLMPEQAHADSPVAQVLVAATGGDLRESSYHVIKAALMAKPGSALSGLLWDVIIPQEVKPGQEAWRDELLELAGQTEGVTRHDLLDKTAFQALLVQRPLLVSQAGGGIVKDIFQHGLRTLMVPIRKDIKQRGIDGDEASYAFQEQQTRAVTLAKAGMVAMLPMSRLDFTKAGSGNLTEASIVETMVEALNKAGQLPVPDIAALQGDGLGRAAAVILGDSLLQQTSLLANQRARQAGQRVLPVS